MLKGVPMAPESNWFLGHALAMMLCVSQNKGAWDILEDWLDVAGDIVQIRVLGTHSIVVKDPRALKRIFQTRFKVSQRNFRCSSWVDLTLCIHGHKEVDCSHLVLCGDYMCAILYPSHAVGGTISTFIIQLHLMTLEH
jgi:hypothetical protein